MANSRIERVCGQCGVHFWTFPAEVRKGGGKFCSRSCATTHRNTHDNPAWRPEVRAKISLNHADVSGKNNPMYMRRGEDAPSYVDGRKSFKGEIYRRILLASGREQMCEVCGDTDNLHVHHRDGNHKNNVVENLSWVCVDCHYKVAHKYFRDERGRFARSELHSF